MNAISMVTGLLGASLFSWQIPGVPGPSRDGTHLTQAGRPLAASTATIAPDCGRDSVAEAIRDLFPPADDVAHARGAGVLALCRTIGAEGALSAALSQTSDARTALAITTALTAFRSPVAIAALREVASASDRPIEVRAVAMPALARAGATDDLVAMLGNVREDESARLTALESLVEGGRPPNAAFLLWLKGHGGARLARRADDMLAALPVPLVATPSTPATSPRATPASTDTYSARPVRAGPLDGTPLAIGASTVAGGALMLNLSLLGFQNTTPQLLLGSAGAVIGFGTSWALSRFGVRPTLEQAAWFTNVTAWGTLAGITVYQGSGSDNYKMRYFSLVAGEVTGMAAGVWSARRWRWTGSQIAMSDGLFLGAALATFGVDRFQNETPQVTPALAIAVVPTMIAAAIAGHALEPTTDDLALMGGAALGAGWIGALMGSGGARADLLGSRQGQGGLLLGFGLGYLGGAAAGTVSEVSPLRLQLGAVGMLAGNAIGLGANMVASGVHRQDSGGFSAGDTDSWKLGAGVGGLALGAAAFALAPHLRPGPAAVPLALWGAGYGAGTYWLASAASYHGQAQNETTDAILRGGMLATGVAGGVTGLLLSRGFAPDVAAQWTTFGATSAGLAAGWGAAALLSDQRGTADAIGVTTGAAVGLSAGALFTHFHPPLRPPSVGAAVGGAAYGALLGALVPSLNAPQWTSDRTTGGATMLGLGGGAVVGTTLGELTGASAAQVTVPLVAGTLGLGMGVGLGSLWPGDSTQPERIGTVVGVAAAGTAGALLMRPLHLADPLPPRSTGLLVTGAAHGIFDGIWLAALADGSGLPSTTPGHQLQGGVLFGGSLGITTGLLLAPHVRLDGGDQFLISGTTLAGASLGRGAALLATTNAGRGDSAGTLAGSLVGTAAGALAASRLDAEPIDAGAAIVGGGYGALVGALAPSLGSSAWPGWNRGTTGGLFLGAGAGASAGFTARRVLRGDDDDVGLTALAGGDGALTGVGWALLLSDDEMSTPYSTTGVALPAESRHLRLGAMVGTAAGLGLGMASWSRLELGRGDSQMIAAAVTLAAWNGAWIPALGHAAASDFDRRKMGGGFLAAAGTTSFAAALLAPVMELDVDAIANAVAMDAVFTAAGAGAGALAGNRADAPVVGMLTGGAAGLVIGGALHRSIEVGSAQAPLLTIGATEGLWAGAWLPYLLRGPAEITDDQRVGGVTAGTFGGLGLSILASTSFAPSGEEVGIATLGSGVGAALGGGVALLSQDIRDQEAVGLMLAGTGVGLGAGGYLAPRLHMDARAAGAGSLGAVLGTSEALLFAWSSRAQGGDQYGGAALLGAGVGTTLGLATNASVDTTGAGTPAIAGFTAWGGWMGAFAGSLFARDAHQITEGGLIGSNVGLLAGYGLLRTGAVDPGDFGWLSLFGAVGTVAGAAAGAPFASQGQPAPILGGLTIGPAVGMVAGALVLPRLRAARDAAGPGAVAWTAERARVFSPFSFFMRGGSGSGATGDGQDQQNGKDKNKTVRRAVPPLRSSEAITRELQEQHHLRRRFARALDASIRISDCAPLIGALPTADSVASGGTPPMLVGITGRWQ